mmetsp:Transcript_30827/g.103852  ORF Transcript_30827/g.103852 Transcript_30827/m.103852 type:complete len:226 (+) Transcript_30827:1616-2293(+)
MDDELPSALAQSAQRLAWPQGTSTKRSLTRPQPAQARSLNLRSARPRDRFASAMARHSSSGDAAPPPRRPSNKACSFRPPLTELSACTLRTDAAPPRTDGSRCCRSTTSVEGARQALQTSPLLSRKLWAHSRHKNWCEQGSLSAMARRARQSVQTKSFGCRVSAARARSSSTHLVRSASSTARRRRRKATVCHRTGAPTTRRATFSSGSKHQSAVMTKAANAVQK